MQTTLSEAKKSGAGVLLSVYHDYHTYTAYYTVAHTNSAFYSTEGTYVEKIFKTFSAACKYFNRICEKYGMSDYVIW